MGIQFKDTEKDYYVITNHPDLKKKAEELGYEEVILYDGDELEEEDVSQLLELDKSVVRILYRLDHREEDGGRDRRYLGDYPHRCVEVTLDLFGNELKDGKRIESLEDAVENFPILSELEYRLRRNAYIRDTDYTGRCGNCQAHLRPGDKYCKYCGTERGKGKFLPFWNESYGVYGPPVKKKYKCTACGHIWITAQLGGDHSKFCPQCGKKTVTVLEDRDSWDFMRFLGVEEPYDEDDRPVLFQEEEIEKLLDSRKEFWGDKEPAPDTFFTASEEKLLAIMRQTGLNVPEKIEDDDLYPRTEKEGEQLLLAEKIMRLDGDNPNGYRGTYCPHCRSRYVAAMGYTVRGEEYRELAKGVHVTGREGALVSKAEGTIDYNLPGDSNEYPAFICLRCGKEFGKFRMPDEMERLYKNDIRKREAEKMKDNLKRAAGNAVGFAIEAGKAAKSAGGKIISDIIQSRVGRNCFERDDFSLLLSEFEKDHEMTQEIRLKLLDAFNKRKINETREDIEKLYDQIMKENTKM